MQISDFWHSQVLNSCVVAVASNLFFNLLSWKSGADQDGHCAEGSLLQQQVVLWSMTCCLLPKWIRLIMLASLDKPTPCSSLGYDLVGLMSKRGKICSPTMCRRAPVHRVRQKTKHTLCVTTACRRPTKLRKPTTAGPAAPQKERSNISVEAWNAF